MDLLDDTFDHTFDHAFRQARLRTILEHADDHAWTMQDIGLLALRLDDKREYRLHVWGPRHSVGELPVHDHPFDFTSTVIAGEMTNTLYAEDPAGNEYRRVRYSPHDENTRRTDTTRLSGVPAVVTAGQRYTQRAHELHASHQLPGTVTVMRMSFVDVSELTVCTLDDGPWMAGRSRPATPDEVSELTAIALERF
jgi:hypothetical protein